MELDYPESLKGQFLMAMPALRDPNFVQTVTFICEHTQAGAVGLVVNRIQPALTGKDIYHELDLQYVPDAESTMIYAGGPVHVNEIFVLHGPPFDWKGCLVITPTLAMSNTIDVLAAVALGRGPESYIITLGCAGWGPGQLEAEIRENAWLTCAVSEEILFEVPAESRWHAAMQNAGVDPALLSDTAGHA